jgi:short-subunit dehydrogenase
MNRLRGKVVAITGASSGIGRAAALEFARHGASVALAARRKDRLEAVVQECRELGARAVAVPIDVNQPENAELLMRTATRELGPVDILVNNAGFAIFDPMEDAKPEDIESIMRTNYFGAVYCTRAVLPSMLERRSGTIVNVASIAGLMGFFRMGAYCASKFALIGFSESLRDEVIDRGVRVCLVCPGTVETEFFQVAERGKMPAASRLILGITPQRVARAIRRAAERGSYRIIIPWPATVFVKFKELFPRSAHFLMRHVSRAIDRGRN